MRGQHQRWAWIAFASAGAAVVIACGLDVTGTGDEAPGVVDQDATTTPTPTAVPTATTEPIPDSGSVDLFDGGGNLDLGDAGDGGDDFEPSDAGPDGGACVVPTLAGSFVADTCCSKGTCRLYAGGNLLDGTYGLKEVAAIGNGEFCNNTYAVLDHDAELVVSTDVDTGARHLAFHEIVQSKSGGRRRNVGRYEVTIPALSVDLTLKAICPGSAVNDKWSYQTTDSGVLLRRQFGNAVFRYTFVAK